MIRETQDEVAEETMMRAHRTETTIDKNGELRIKQVPFQPGDTVEVIVLARHESTGAIPLYPLRGTPIEYENPTEPIAAEEWEATT